MENTETFWGEMLSTGPVPSPASPFPSLHIKKLFWNWIFFLIPLQTVAQTQPKAAINVLNLPRSCCRAGKWESGRGAVLETLPRKQINNEEQGNLLISLSACPEVLKIMQFFKENAEKQREKKHSLPSYATWSCSDPGVRSFLAKEFLGSDQ